MKLLSKILFIYIVSICTISYANQGMIVNTKSFTIPIFITQESSIEGVNIVLSYDPKYLKLSNLTLKGGILSKWENFCRLIKSKGLAAIALSGEKIIKGKGKIAFISFEILQFSNSIPNILLKKLHCNGKAISGGFLLKDNNIKRNLKIYYDNKMK